MTALREAQLRAVPLADHREAPGRLGRDEFVAVIVSHASGMGVLSTLIERKLIKTVGRKQVVGRPFMYATTREFLERFGLNDLSDLPKVDEMSDALGFELPNALIEPTVGTSPLPFDADPVVNAEPVAAGSDEKVH